MVCRNKSLDKKGTPSVLEKVAGEQLDPETVGLFIKSFRDRSRH